MLENDAEVPVEDLIKLYYPEQYKEMDLEVAELPADIELGEGGELVSGEDYTVVAHLDEEKHQNGTDVYDGVDGVASVESDIVHEELLAESADVLDDEEHKSLLEDENKDLTTDDLQYIRESAAPQGELEPGEMKQDSPVAESSISSSTGDQTLE